MLVASAIAGLLHVLVASVRRRRRDLAVLKTIGFSSRQVSAVVAWQASTLMIVALLIGLPLGVLAGRWTWTAFAHSIGVPAYPVVPALVLAATFFGALIVANVIAAGPGWIAARTRPAVVLRRP